MEIIAKTKLKGTFKSQSKYISFEEYKKCLEGEEQKRECDNYVIRSLILEMYLQKVKKSTLSICDDKKNYLNIKECLPWN